MVNLFFITRNYSGARTYTDELLGYLSIQKGIKVHKVYLESPVYKEYTVLNNNGIRIIHIPAVEWKVHVLEKYASRCIDLMDPLLRGKKNIIFHLNYSTQIKLGLEARKR
jgi:hypothetical protein